MSKTLVIISGQSGSGKSTLAEIIGGVICTADDLILDITRDYVKEIKQ